MATTNSNAEPPPVRLAYVIGVGREAAPLVTNRLASQGENVHCEAESPPRSGGSLIGVSAHLADQVTAVLSFVTTHETQPHIVLVGASADPFTLAFFEAFQPRFAREAPEGTLLALWTLPGADAPCPTQYQSARLLAATLEVEDASFGWTAASAESVADARGLDHRNAPVKNTAYLRELIQCIASSRFGDAIITELRRTRKTSFIMASAIGASLLVFQEQTSRGDATLSNIVRLAAMNPLLAVDLNETNAAATLIQASETIYYQSEPADTDRQVTEALNTIANGHSSSASVLEAVPAANIHYVSCVVAASGARLTNVFRPLIAGAARGNTESGDQAARHLETLLARHDAGGKLRTKA